MESRLHSTRMPAACRILKSSILVSSIVRARGLALCGVQLRTYSISSVQIAKEAAWCAAQTSPDSSAVTWSSPQVQGSKKRLFPRRRVIRDPKESTPQAARATRPLAPAAENWILLRFSILFPSTQTKQNIRSNVKLIDNSI